MVGAARVDDADGSALDQYGVVSAGRGLDAESVFITDLAEVYALYLDAVLGDDGDVYGVAVI